MTAVAIISLIISVALSVDITVANAIAKKKNNALTKTAAKLQKEISNDQTTLTALLDAYTRKDARLASDIIYSSPFGSRFQSIKKELLATKDKIAETQQAIVDQQKEANRVNKELSEAEAKTRTSGSTIGDLISGAVKGEKLEKYNFKDFLGPGVGFYKKTGRNIKKIAKNIKRTWSDYANGPTDNLEYHPSDIPDQNFNQGGNNGQ